MGFIENKYDIIKDKDKLSYDCTLTIICDKCGTYMYHNYIYSKRDENNANFGLYLCPKCAKDILLNNKRLSTVS
jgi:hypothetical protein